MEIDNNVTIDIRGSQINSNLEVLIEIITKAIPLSRRKEIVIECEDQKFSYNNINEVRNLNGKIKVQYDGPMFLRMHKNIYEKSKNNLYK